MAKYTFEIRELFEPIKFSPPLFTRDEVESWFKDYDLYDFLTVEQVNVIEKAGIWSKDKLAKKIIDHYYMRESGLETIGLFKHYAKVEMQELMEEYLPLIYSASIKYDPLINVDFTEKFQRTASIDNSETVNANNNATGDTYAMSSDTPQGRVTKESILNGNYASSTTGGETTNSSESTSNASSESDSKEEYTKTIRGNSGVSATNQKMIEQYRDNIIAIDRKIIKELNILFMGLF